MDEIAKKTESCNTDWLPPKADPPDYEFFGVPALVAYNEAYRVARRIERGCEMSERGFLEGARDERTGGSQ